MSTATDTSAGTAPTATKTVLEVLGLHRTYGSVRAVDDVSFRLAAGGSLGIVGESGSGKTTTARIVVGLEHADEGRVLIHGRDRGEHARGKARRLARAREVQMVFQDPFLSLDPRTTVGAALRRPSPCTSPARTTRAGSPNCSTRSASAPARRTRCPGSCREDSASASRSPARWRSNRPSSSSTRPWPRWTSRYRPRS